jgi:hypothetical protein
MMRVFFQCTSIWFIFQLEVDHAQLMHSRRNRAWLEERRTKNVARKPKPPKRPINYLSSDPSHIEGVSVGALEIAVNRTLLTGVTSCNELISRHFSSGLKPVPLVPYEKPELEPTTHDKKLMFLHIPKNACTTIEAAPMTARLTPDEANKARRRFPLGDTLFMVHNSTIARRRPGNNNAGAVDFVSSYFRRHRPRVEQGIRPAYFISVPESTHQCKCSYWHIPPRYLEHSAPSFTVPPLRTENVYINSKVFCVVRDPLDRALSEFKMRTKKAPPPNSTSAAVNAFLIELASTQRFQPLCRHDCHFLPQYE